MGLWRVMWEADVEAGDPVEACHNVRDAFTLNQDCGRFRVVQFVRDEVGPIIEVQPFSGPLPGVVVQGFVGAPVVFKP